MGNNANKADLIEQCWASGMSVTEAQAVTALPEPECDRCYAAFERDTRERQEYMDEVGQ